MNAVGNDIREIEQVQGALMRDDRVVLAYRKPGRGDMLTRGRAYRIAREIGVYNANELRKFEKANPRTDAEGEVYLAPSNMQPEQTGQPVADRGGGNAAEA